MAQGVLLIAMVEGIESCTRRMEEELQVQVDVARSRSLGLDALRCTEYAVVVIEESLVEGDPAWADEAWELTGFAVPLQFNFAISGCGRLCREVRAAMARRDREQAIARRSVATEIENELKTTLTGLLLQSELAMREPTVPAALEPKLKHVVEMAGAIRDRLRRRIEARP
jgi:signal transduction histidine kinase